MLEQLVAEIRAGGTLETGALAVRLGTIPELVKAMLEHLQRAGYIQPYGTGGDSCGGCNLQKECHPPQSSSSKSDALHLFVLADPKSDTADRDGGPSAG